MKEALILTYLTWRITAVRRFIAELIQWSDSPFPSVSIRVIAIVLASSCSDLVPTFTRASGL